MPELRRTDEAPRPGDDSAGIERYLRWLGEPVDPPALAPARDPPYFKPAAARTQVLCYAALAPARDPPYFKSRVIRRRLGEPAQAELFEAH